jgi:hypothetical protein
MDSGAEMTVVKELHPSIVNMNNNKHIDLIYGNNQTSRVNLSGNIGNIEVLVSDHVSDNILSIPQLTSMGRVIITTPEKMYVFKPGTTIDVSSQQLEFQGEKRNGLYYCEFDTLVEAMQRASI